MVHKSVTSECSKHATCNIKLFTACEMLHESVHSVWDVTWKCSQRLRCYMKVFTASEMLHESVHSVWDVTWKCSERVRCYMKVFRACEMLHESVQSVWDVTWKCSERSTKSVLDVTRMCWRVLHVSQDHRTLLHAPPKPPCSGGRM